MEILRVSERQLPFRNLCHIMEVSEQLLTAIDKQYRVYELRTGLKTFIPSLAPPENQVYMYVFQYN
jgi:hypothetical protein